MHYFAYKGYLLMEFSFKDILRIIKKNIIFIIVVSLVCAAGSFVVTKFVVKKTYTATVKLHVNTNNGSLSINEDLISYNYAEKLVTTYINMLDTNRFFSAVSDALDNDYSASELKSMVKFTGVEDTELFKADIVSEDPKEAKRIADAVADTAPATIEQLLQKSAKLDIVDEAQVPKAPTSPNVAKNTLIFFVAGLVCSLIIAFIRDYFDVKVKYDSDMTTICDLPILAAIPEFEFSDNNRKSSKQQ